MSLFEQAMHEMKSEVLDELEQKMWERLEPRIQQELHARHMSVADTADYLHVSEATVRRMIKDRDIPSFKVRNQILIRQMDVDEWIQKQITEGR